MPKPPSLTPTGPASSPAKSKSSNSAHTTPSPFAGTPPVAPILTPTHIPPLQRAIGNQAVNTLLPKGASSAAPKHKPTPTITPTNHANGAPQVQRDPEQEKVTLNGYSKSITKGDKKELKGAITELSMKGVKPVKGNTKPQAVMLMGASGSGKSSIINDVVTNPASFVHADPDAVKAAMPAYKAGVAAGNKNIASTVHNESKDITKSVVTQTVATRRNLLYDGTGGNLTEYDGMIDSFHNAGYHVKLVMTHISLSEGLKRVAARAAATGRDIPDQIVKDMYHYVPQNFPLLVNKVEEAFLFNNMVPQGQPPTLIWEKSNGKTLSNVQINTLKDILASISASQVVDNGQADSDNNALDGRPLDANRRYLQEGGTTRWMKDAGSGITSRREISNIDASLKRYRLLKSKNMGNAEEQGQLLLGMQRDVLNSRYQSDTNKNTKTFVRRKQATSMLATELEAELPHNPKRLARDVSVPDKIQELTRIGFTAPFLGDLLKFDLKMLYQAHAALSHRQNSMAQVALDKINPVERDDQGKLKYAGNYVSRTRNSLHFAQQVLTAHHNVNIGGRYAKAFRTPVQMNSAKTQKVTDDYIRNKDFLSEDTLDTVKNKGSGVKSLADMLNDFTGLTSQEIEAIRIYSSSKYREMNATMHDVRLDDQDEQKGGKGYMSISQVAIAGLSKLPSFGGAALYRGDTDFGGLLNLTKVGASFQLPSFMSTSKAISVAVSFGGDVGWMILPSANSRGKDIEQISVVQGEHEVLFPPGAKMKVVEVFRRDTNAQDIPGEKKADKVRRTWHSDAGNEMTNEVYRFLLAFPGKRNTLVVVQEVG